MAYATDIVEVVAKLIDTLLANKDALLLQDVFEGDQNLIPRTPAVCVIAGEQLRETWRASIPPTVKVSFEVYLMVYHGGVQDLEVTERQTLERTNAIKRVLDLDTTLGGLVIYGMVERAEPGYLNRNHTPVRVTRLTWSGFSQVRIGV